MGNAMNRYRAGLPMMALKGRLTSATSNWTFSVRKFTSVPNVTGREMVPTG
jgi:transcription elongation factor